MKKLMFLILVLLLVSVVVGQECSYDFTDCEEEKVCVGNYYKTAVYDDLKVKERLDFQKGSCSEPLTSGYMCWDDNDCTDDLRCIGNHYGEYVSSDSGLKANYVFGICGELLDVDEKCYGVDDCKKGICDDAYFVGSEDVAFEPGTCKLVEGGQGCEDDDDCASGECIKKVCSDDDQKDTEESPDEKEEIDGSKEKEKEENDDSGFKNFKPTPVGNNIQKKGVSIDQSKRAGQIDEVWLKIGVALSNTHAETKEIWYKGSWVKKSNAVSSSSGTGNNEAVRRQVVNQRVVDIAVREYERWKKGGWKEDDEEGFKIIKEEYAKAVLKKQELKKKPNGDVPHWSAYFTSYVMKTAGTDFPPRIGHSAYFRAIQNGRSRDCQTFRISDIDQIQPGDLVCNCRTTGEKGCPVDYDDFPRRGQISYGHCDIVVERKGDALKVIGGNVGNKVNKRPRSISVIKSKSDPKKKIDGQYYGWISCRGGTSGGSVVTTPSSVELKPLQEVSNVAGAAGYYEYESSCLSKGDPPYGRVEGLIVPRNAINPIVNFYFHGNKEGLNPKTTARDLIKKRGFGPLMEDIGQDEVMVVLSGGKEHRCDCLDPKWDSQREEVVCTKPKRVGKTRLDKEEELRLDSCLWMVNGEFNCFYQEAIDQIKTLELNPSGVSFMAHSGGGGKAARAARVIKRAFTEQKYDLPLKNFIFFDACYTGCVNTHIPSLLSVFKNVYLYYADIGPGHDSFKEGGNHAREKYGSVENLRVTYLGDGSKHNDVPQKCFLDRVYRTNKEEGCLG